VDGWGVCWLFVPVSGSKVGGMSLGVWSWWKVVDVRCILFYLILYITIIIHIHILY
jgi:hypothetical protein